MKDLEKAVLKKAMTLFNKIYCVCRSLLHFGSFRFQEINWNYIYNKISILSRAELHLVGHIWCFNIDMRTINVFSQNKSD